MFRTYKNLRRESIRSVPSVLDFHSISSNISDHEYIGKTQARNRLAYRGRPLEKEEIVDPVSQSVFEDTPLRYDVDIVTKLIVYSGIGFIAVFAVPILFFYISNICSTYCNH